MPTSEYFKQWRKDNPDYYKIYRKNNPKKIKKIKTRAYLKKCEQYRKKRLEWADQEVKSRKIQWGAKDAVSKRAIKDFQLKLNFLIQYERRKRWTALREDLGNEYIKALGNSQ